MTGSIFSNGKEYISAIRAAEKIGYASDYIGQLCRAKKIPGQLIGKSWYVDFTSLVEHKKNRQLGKVKKTSTSAKLENLRISPVSNRLQSTGPILSARVSVRQTGEHDENLLTSSSIILPRSLDNPVFTYEKEDKPRLPELSKKSRYVEPVWTPVLFKQAVVSSLALLVAVSAGFATLERTAPSIAVEVRQKMENVQDDGKQFLIALPGHLTRNEKLAAASLFSGIDEFFGGIITGFRHLKEIALNKIFFARTPTKIAEIPPPPKAVAEITRSLDLGSLKSELKTELENYIRLRIDALRPPVVVYSSSPIASADLNAFKNSEVIPAIYYSVTNQSNSDMDQLSASLNRLTTNGTFGNITVTGTCTG
ncbi:MAG: hypothetical protein AAB782_01480, partial [Patescibacteria group bacterium]